ncbi:MAG: DUF2807 domain-containing protein [Rhizobacter sp.]|nr:DUF2807 domain-containing protein [Rhizobacter sp.]
MTDHLVHPLAAPPIATHPLARRAAALVFLLALAAAMVQPAWAAAPGSGRVVRQARPLGDFSAVSVASAARVELRQGDRASVEVEADDALLPLIGTRVVDGSLVVEDLQPFRSSQARVLIVVRRLTSLAVGGSTAVRVEGLNTPSLALSLGGSSVTTVSALRAARLHVSAGGSSALSVEGAADDVSLSLGGSSTVDARAFPAAAVSVAAGGSAQAQVWARGALSLTLAGASSVRYYGTPTLSLTRAGSATVTALGEAPSKAR